MESTLKTNQHFAIYNEIIDKIDNLNLFSSEKIEEEHKFIMILEDNGQKFIGIAKTNPLDYEFESDIFGYQLAEYRASQDYLQQLSHDTKVKFKELTHLYNVFKNSSAIEKEDNSFKIIQKRYFYYQDKLFVIDIIYKSFDSIIKNAIQWKDKFNTTEALQEYISIYDDVLDE